MLNEDVEKIIKYGKYFAQPQISLDSIRERQDEQLTSSVINSAKAKMRLNNVNKVKEPLFFVGSVDYMVRNESGKKNYYILETNGGNSRGFSALAFKQWENSIKCYTESLAFVRSNNPTIIIGHPNKDLILFEKIMLARYMAKILKKNNNKAEVVHIDNLESKRLNEGALIILGPYSKILPRLSVYKNNYVYFDGKKIDVLVGDGIARRKPEVIEHLAKNDLKTLVVNDIFFLTDDKALTYLAVQEAATILKQFSVEPIAFKSAENKKYLADAIGKTLEEIPEILIKPHGGSGGSGIDLITEKKHIDATIESSIRHYHKKFGEHRDPFPYTICQRVHATPVEWNEALHHFDIRVYVGRQKDRIVPLGSLLRIALEPFAGRFKKKSFVVNLSGYEGIDTNRGFGLHKDSLRLFNLDKNDFVNMFSSACAIIAYMNNNYEYLMGLAFKNEKN